MGKQYSKVLHEEEYHSGPIKLSAKDESFDSHLVASMSCSLGWSHLVLRTRQVVRFLSLDLGRSSASLGLFLHPNHHNWTHAFPKAETFRRPGVSSLCVQTLSSEFALALSELSTIITVVLLSPCCAVEVTRTLDLHLS